MSKQDVEHTLISILRDDFSVRGAVTSQSLICYEVGICDGEFEDFMALVESRCNLSLPTPCHLPFREDEATLGMIADWVQRQKAS